MPRGTAHEFRRTAITMLESMGISVEFSHHEAGPGQNEIDLRYADALTTADNIMTFRTAIKEVALEQGVFASFMPKPLANGPGSGMHTHLSLFEGDRNAFHEAGVEHQLSTVARQFMAGLLKHAPEITAVTNQYVNSYKRLWGGAEAPSLRVLGLQQPFRAGARPDPQARQGSVGPRRVPRDRLGRQPVSRVLRDPCRGPQGHRGGYELPDGAEDDVWELSRAERKAMGYEPLPASLAEAVAVMEKSELVAETLGESVFDFFLRNKRAEWEAYRAQVTPFELERYLSVL